MCRRKIRDDLSMRFTAGLRPNTAFCHNYFALRDDYARLIQLRLGLRLLRYADFSSKLVKL